MNVINLVVGIPFKFGKRHSLGVGAIEEQTVDNAGSQLLDFGHADLEDLVNPVNDMIAGGEDSG